MFINKVIAFLALATAAASSPVPDWSDGNTTPFELSSLQTYYSPGNSTAQDSGGLGFQITDPDTRTNTTCSILWGPRFGDLSNLTVCTDQSFGFRFDSFTNFKEFEIEMWHLCPDNSAEGCRTELGSAGFKADDPDWEMSKLADGSQRGNYKGTLAVPVYPEW